MAEDTDNSFSFPPVGEAESGQKLLRFLQRRLNLPESLLHRWLRTGQIRLNGRRCKPFVEVQTGDQVRLPPFVNKLKTVTDAPEPPHCDAGFPPLVFAEDAIWGFDKPAGLATQNGSGITDSMASRLAAHYQECSFIPAPAHRLDRATSGLLLCGATFEAQKKLQAQFRSGQIHKEYLAWTYGNLPFNDQRLVCHYLEGKDRVLAFAKPAPGRKEARCIIRPIRSLQNSTLLQIRLLTGRKRQIRAQLAALGAPVWGDFRYGAPAGSLLRLHAFRIILPDDKLLESLPVWSDPWNVEELPEPILQKN